MNTVGEKWRALGGTTVLGTILLLTVAGVALLPLRPAILVAAVARLALVVVLLLVLRSLTRHLDEPFLLARGARKAAFAATLVLALAYLALWGSELFGPVDPHSRPYLLGCVGLYSAGVLALKLADTRRPAPTARTLDPPAA